MKKLIAATLLFGCLWLLTPATALASIGVGVGTGRIAISEDIKAGSIYTLPPITVFNTGTETAVYSMAVTLNEKQPQLKPDPKWFSFSPNQFSLAPHQAQKVVPTFSPPLVTKPGDYFAYLEARPAKTVKQGLTSVGIAAATKVSFRVKASNIFLATWYRLAALYKQGQPWSMIVTGLVLVGGAYRILRRYIKIQVSRA